MSALSTQPGSATAIIRRCDESRIAGMIDAIAAISDSGEGINRIAYTATERRAHELVAAGSASSERTCASTAWGNTIAEFAGREPALAAIGTGSHLDSVPHGGRFDGIAGVVAAIEAMRTMIEDGAQLRHPFRIIAFASEEGARFGQACLGSKAVAGMIATSDAHALRRSRRHHAGTSDGCARLRSRAHRRRGLESARLVGLRGIAHRTRSRARE